MRTSPRRRGLFEAMIDAIGGALNDFGGLAVTRVSAPLSATADGALGVETTIGFGQLVDGSPAARLLVGGEIIEAAGRTNAPPYGFVGLVRGVDGTTPAIHPAGTLVLDLSGNTSALHRLRRGLFVNTASDEDLDVIGRNYGLHRCYGLSTEQWRRVIRTLSYLPRQPISAFEDILLALLDDPNAFRVTERPWSDPWKVFAEIDVPGETGDDAIEGSFVLTGGEAQLTTGTLTVNTDYPIGSVLGVYAASTRALRGERVGLTNYYAGAGSFAGNTITLDSSPGPAGTAVVIDYSVNPSLNYHYLATNEAVSSPLSHHRPYFGDGLTPVARCLLNEVRSAGIQVVLTTRPV